MGLNHLVSSAKGFSSLGLPEVAKLLLVTCKYITRPFLQGGAYQLEIISTPSEMVWSISISYVVCSTNIASYKFYILLIGVE